MKDLQDIIKSTDLLDELDASIAEVNHRFFNGDSPLHICCGRGDDLTAVELLINNGADINAIGEDGMTPLHSAVMGRNPHIVELLIKSGASVSIADALFFQTPLQAAQVALTYEKSSEIANIERIIALLESANR